MNRIRSLSIVGICVCFVSSVSAQDSVSPLDSEGHVVNFQRDIGPIFVKHCLECHGPEDTKADFRIDVVDEVMNYVEPGDLESSSMYIDYMLSEDEDMLMPPKSHGGPLSPGELTLIRVWIEEGASWPEGVGLTADAPPPEKKVAKERSLPGRLWAFQGFFHPATVHFPVALFTVGAFFVVVGWKWPKLGDQIPLACLWLGAPSAVAATMMGMAFAPEQGYSDWTNFNMDSEIFWHRWSGVIVAIVAVIFAVVALKAVKQQNEKLMTAWKVGLLLLAGMVGAVGHQGGELAYGADLYQRAINILTGATDEADESEDEAEQAEPSDDNPAETAQARAVSEVLLKG